MKVICNNFNQQNSEICFLGGISDILNYSGYKISEAFLLGMSTGLRFDFYPSGDPESPAIKEEEDKSPDFKCIGIRFDAEYTNNIYNTIGVKVETHNGKSDYEIIKDIKTELSMNRPLMITINMAFMPYLPERLRTTSTHVIICFGIDEEVNKAYISDNFITTIPRSTYLGEMELDKLLQAMRINGIFKNCYSEYITVKPVNKYINSSTEEIKKAIRRSSTQMLEISKDILCQQGIDGIKEFAKMFNTEGNFDFSDDFQIWLKKVHNMLIVGGPIPTRKEYAKFLEWALLEKKVDINNKSVDLCKEIAGEWQLIANIVAKAFLIKNENIINRIYLKLNEIYKKEKMLAELLIV